MHPDVLTVLTLCLALPEDEPDLRVLTGREWSLLAAALESRGKSPGVLLEERIRALWGLTLEPSIVERLPALLNRAPLISDEVTRLRADGLWVLTRADADYPEKLIGRLGNAAPPVLFGVGDHSALRQATLAVTGSRTVSEADVAFAQEVGERAAAEHLPLVSGSAPGTDLSAMRAAMDAGGVAVGVLPGSLTSELDRPRARHLVDSGRLTLVSCYHPNTDFSVGNAMGRNRLIYCLGDHAIVVASGQGRGGTWHGATECLDGNWTPLFVRDAPDAPDGNRELLRYRSLSGAHAVALDALPDGPLLPFLDERAVRHPDLHALLQASLAGFGVAAQTPPPALRVVRPDDDTPSETVLDEEAQPRLF